MEIRATLVPVLLAAVVFLCSLSEAACDCEEFTCSNGVCVAYDALCDRKDDCGNNEDEDECVHRFTCDNRTRCMPPWWVCDGRHDCEDGSDEKDCAEKRNAVLSSSTAGATMESTLTTPSQDVVMDEAAGTTRTRPRFCNVENGDFPCLDGGCLLPVQVCDGVRDCSDGADEGRFCQLVCHGSHHHHDHHYHNVVIYL
ncbi:hypothetical protein MRX96_014537 [Rhipicephalus microplus]